MMSALGLSKFRDLVDARFTPEPGHWATAVTVRRTKHEQGDSVCGGRASREYVLDRAGATKLLRWQSCRLAAHGRRGGVPVTPDHFSAIP